MKKEITIAVLLLSLFALPAYAVSDHSNSSDHANERSEVH